MNTFILRDSLWLLFWFYIPVISPTVQMPPVMELMGHVWNVAKLGKEKGSFKMTMIVSAVVTKVIMFKV